VPTIRGRIAHVIVRIIVKHWPKNDPAATVRRARKVFGEPKLVRFKPGPDLRIEQIEEGSIRGEWITPPNLRFPDATLLYFHGGGYVSCSARTHRPITTELARRIGCRVFAPDYRLAPEHPFPAAAEDAVAAAEWLMSKGINKAQIALAGDSAGGGLTIATLVSLRDCGLPLPACAACLSPWVDLTGELSITNPTSCAMFFPADGLAFAKIYLNGASAKSVEASPLLADLKGLPPLLIQVADRELLFDDSIRLSQKAKAAGVETRLHIYPGMPHVWQILGKMVPEAGTALDEIAEFVSEKLSHSRNLYR